MNVFHLSGLVPCVTHVLVDLWVHHVSHVHNVSTVSVGMTLVLMMLLISGVSQGLCYLIELCSYICIATENRIPYVYCVYMNIGKCDCNSDQWGGILCDECSSGFWGPLCEPCPACVNGYCSAENGKYVKTAMLFKRR